MATSAAEVAIEYEEQTQGFTTRAPRSLWSDARRRLLRNKAAVASMIYLAVLVVVAVAAPLLAPDNPLKINFGNSYREAAWIKTPDRPENTGISKFPLGTDAIGRDVLSRLIYGTRTSLVVGFIPMILTLSIGSGIGLISGYTGGGGDGALSLVSWVGVARLVRGQVLSLKEKEFIEAARAIGVRNYKILLRHLLPNSLGPIIVSGAFIVPGAIITEAVLSYLGIGLIPATNPKAIFPVSWGNMILDGKAAITAQPMMLVAPAIAIATVTMAFTFIGDGLPAALDPREK